MAIIYSTRLQSVKNHEEEKRVYASTQSNHMMDLDDVSEHISEHNSVYSPDVVAGVTKKAVELMGFEAGSLRLPLTEIEEEHAKNLAQAMKDFSEE